jgi:hypothetical protein
MAVTSWKSPGTITSETRTGGSVVWTNPSNAASDDGSYATSGSLFLTGSHWLWSVNYGFSTSDIPDGSTITGIEIDLDRKSTRGSGTEPTLGSIAYYKLIKAGAETGTQKTDTTTLPTSDTVISKGGDGDMWGATISDSDARSSTTGLSYAYYEDGYGSFTAYADAMRMRYYYTAPVTFLNKQSSAFLLFHSLCNILIRFFGKMFKNKNQIRIYIPLDGI